MKCAKRQNRFRPHPASFRRKNLPRGVGFILFACPQRRWRRGKCYGGVKVYEIVKTNVKQCNKGYRRA